MTLKKIPIIAGEGRWYAEVALVDYRRVWRPVSDGRLDAATRTDRMSRDHA